MIDVKTAIQRASDFLRSVYPDAGQIRLEEVEAPESPHNEWGVTLSFLEFPSRVFKRIVLDAESGNVKAMRIRETVS